MASNCSMHDSKNGATSATSQANETVIKLANDQTIGGLLLESAVQLPLPLIESPPPLSTQSTPQPEQPEQLSLFEGGDAS